jgi:hypothetical protein
VSEPTVFQLQCGCLLSVEAGGMNEPCPVHDLEGVTPLEAMIIVFRERLSGDSPEEAMAFIQRKRDEINDGKPVASFPGESA